ncbi:flavin reductase family protein [Streptomyces sp. NPDC029674]|uniref:flavin reductase family protein n=1 Tax=Streptomyces sp. NPDC029674 TaxID=3365297 RepID=UPI00384D0D61
MTATPTNTQRPRPPVPIDGKTLRSVCGLFVTGVTVITSGGGERAAGTTVNSFTSVSLDPPLVLFCLHQASRLRALVEESGAYTVNFLAGRQEPLAWAFAGRHTATLQDVEHRYSAVGVPVLSQAMAFLSCRLVNAFEGGDHTIFVGEVAELGVPRADTEPLIFFRGSMGSLEDEPRGPHPMFDS